MHSATSKRFVLPGPFKTFKHIQTEFLSPSYRKRDTSVWIPCGFPWPNFSCLLGSQNSFSLLSFPFFFQCHVEFMAHTFVQPWPDLSCSTCPIYYCYPSHELPLTHPDARAQACFRFLACNRPLIYCIGKMKSLRQGRYSPLQVYWAPICLFEPQQEG